MGTKFKEFKFHFIDKKNKNGVITGGINPYNQHENKIDIYSIFYGEENTPMSGVSTLTFRSEERAAQLYEEYNQKVLYMRNRNYNLSPVEVLKIKELELNMLEESSALSHKSTNMHTLQTKIHFKEKTGNEMLPVLTK
jgi:hypothetical protein